ncbi:hypothetical protein BCE_4800 [Bacillus cereus ATCC 10987]|uniref:Uncharacterized protein n=1 Tax=Bacillus cereus (strain ATCC 10987 / NRS 248) TaxID=222523 RepID=Q72Z69_BACC1|nr:hypothetical protein BCE_4800 [Bacillus cereus ATCC 10987]
MSGTSFVTTVPDAITVLSPVVPNSFLRFHYVILILLLMFHLTFLVNTQACSLFNFYVG